ncbi:type I-E CRISPR-associated protein Cas6/Cse3/CasE [Streptomyces sp. NPDC054783]
MTTPAPHPATATLTRIRLNPHSPRARHDLKDTLSLHRRITLLTPDDLGDHPRQKAGLLFRLEEATDHTPPTLLIQSHQPPDLTRLPDTYGTAETRDLTPMFQALIPGRRVRYRIIANPTRRLTGPNPTGSKHGKLIALYGDDALTWWQQRAHQAGLTLITTDATPVRTACARPPRTDDNRSDGERVYALTRFDGLATISNPERLTDAVLNGIGRAKSYGAGLLTLAPA